MKSFFSAAAIALLVFSASAAPASASIATVNDQLKFYRGLGTNGGIFHVDNLTTNGPSSSPYDFDTFCVQISEHIILGSETYRVASITDHTVLGNVPLGSFAAWLYTKFLDGAISILDNQDANAVQVGIWRSMGYLLSGDNTSPVGSNYDGSLLGSLVAPTVGTLTYQYYADLTW